MAYKYGERYQLPLFADSIDNNIAEDDPVRAYDVFIDALDIEELGIKIDENKVGNSEYYPITMLKLLTYAYSYGWRSSRKIERALHHNLSFIWLTGGLKPDFKTISEFRRKNKPVIKKVLKKCVRICIDLDLIEGNTLFVDGTKIRANASRNKSYTKEKYEKLILKIDERIDEILNECEDVDHEEKDRKSLVKMKKELVNKKELKIRIQSILKEYEEEGHKTKDGVEKKKNLTDPDCKNMRSVQGSHASYNIQSVVDAKNRLIVNMAATSDPLDVDQFTQQITEAENIMESECITACGDAGYSNVDNLEAIDSRGTTKVIVPSKKQALHNEEKPFNKNEFSYNDESNCYFCPMGKKLKFKGYQKDGKQLVYVIEDSRICRNCQHYGRCTSSKSGRRIIRLKNEKLKEKLEKQYEQQDSQEIYKERKCTVEHPFGHIKRNLGMIAFLLRGIEGAQAEISLSATCFNITRMITIFGSVQNFINIIKKIKVKS